MLQSVERCANHVVRVRRTGRLGNNVMNAQRFENSAHRTTGDDTGTGLGRTQQNLACAVTAIDVVMQRAAIAQRNEDQIALCALGCLTDGFRNFASLAVTEANAALLVADDDESGEAKATATLNNLCNAVDRDQLVDEFAIAFFTVLAVVARTSFSCAIVLVLFLLRVERQTKRPPASMKRPAWPGEIPPRSLSGRKLQRRVSKPTRKGRCRILSGA